MNATIMKASSSAKIRLPVSVCVSAMACLVLLPVENAQAGNDITTCGAVLQVGVHAATAVAHTNDIVVVDAVGAEVAGSVSFGGCDLTNVVTFLIKPDNSFQVVITNCYLPTGPGNALTPAFFCPSGVSANGGSGQCVPTASYSYRINATDVGQGLSFSNHYYLTRDLLFLGVPAQANFVHFGVAGAGLVPTFDGQGTNVASSQGQFQVRIIHPHIAVSEQYPTTYGQTVSFSGFVTNDGDVMLNNVTISDDQATTIAFATNTCLGNSFPAAGGGSLAANDCVQYFGNYSPTGNLSRPFTNQVTASGTDLGTFGLPSALAQTVFATNAATAWRPVTIFDARVERTNFMFSFATVPGYTNTVQFAESASHSIWQDMTNLSGDGTVATIADSLNHPQRFYRVWVR